MPADPSMDVYTKIKPYAYIFTISSFSIRWLFCQHSVNVHVDTQQQKNKSQRCTTDIQQHINFHSKQLPYLLSNFCWGQKNAFLTFIWDPFHINYPSIQTSSNIASWNKQTAQTLSKIFSLVLWYEHNYTFSPIPDIT